MPRQCPRVLQHISHAALPGGTMTRTLLFSLRRAPRGCTAIAQPRYSFMHPNSASTFLFGSSFPESGLNIMLLSRTREIERGAPTSALRLLFSECGDRPTADWSKETKCSPFASLCHLSFSTSDVWTLHHIPGLQG